MNNFCFSKLKDLKFFVGFFLIVFSAHCQAANEFGRIFLYYMEEFRFQMTATPHSIDWSVGQFANYEWTLPDCSPSPQYCDHGTINVSVTAEEGDAVWLEIKSDGPNEHDTLQKLIDRKDGHVIRIIVNGVEGTPNAPKNHQIVRDNQQVVTVPAGTFDARHLYIYEFPSIETWENPNINLFRLALMRLIMPGPWRVELALNSFGNLRR